MTPLFPYFMGCLASALIYELIFIPSLKRKWK